jgi:NADPH:quinone reductase-like Zn-dependent oxidoreductase
MVKAVVYTKYGLPDVLRIKKLEKPIPKENEVLIKVFATTVTATDCTFRKGKPFFSRLFTGITKPKNQILGSEFTGEIESTGKDVKLFKAGDQVLGTTPGYGSYAEYLCLPAGGATLALKGDKLNYKQAIACCDGFLTALPFLRDKGKIKSKDKVLINGASGSVGSAAIQLAKYFGAEVTGVCSAANLELVKSFGADYVIDYDKENFTNNGKKYDVIFDTVGKISFSKCKRSLTKKGIFLEAGITLTVLPQVLITSLISSKKVKIMATGLRHPDERTNDLKFVIELAETQKIKPVIDRVYSLKQIAEAHRYVDTGHKKGNVVISLEHK